MVMGLLSVCDSLAIESGYQKQINAMNCMNKCKQVYIQFLNAVRAEFMRFEVELVCGIHQP